MRKIVYMEWVKLRPRAKYEIGGSGVTGVHADELPEAREAFDLNDFNLYGYRPLVDRIAARYEVQPERVVTTQGCSMANYLAFAAVLKPGAEALIEHPVYEPIIDVAELLGAKVRRFTRPFKRGFRIDLEGLASKITKRTRLIALTNMHNPSGALEPPEVLEEIGRLARKVGAYVVVDEVYLEFLFEARPKSSVHLGDNFLITASLTKAFGLDGLRCGWILGSPKMVKAIWRLQDFFGVNGAIPAEKASTAAFEHLDRLIERTRRIMSANRPLVDKFMAAHSDTLDWVAPAGGPVCFPRLKHGAGRKFADQLRTKYDTGVIPGHFFEMPKHFRLGFGGSTELLEAGLERLGQALDHWVIAHS